MVFHGLVDHVKVYIIGEMLYVWKHNLTTLLKKINLLVNHIFLVETNGHIFS
jgi:uncharacterized Fe-S cluster-containing radical SAM superfamily protein